MADVNPSWPRAGAAGLLNVVARLADFVID
jgi:hypothetical protein